MRFYELDLLVRKETDKFRLYDWKQIESMREDLASYGAGLSDVNAKLFLYESLLEQLIAYRKQLREQKQYEVADRLRQIIIDSDVPIKNDKPA